MEQNVNPTCPHSSVSEPLREDPANEGFVKQLDQPSPGDWEPQYPVSAEETFVVSSLTDDAESKLPEKLMYISIGNRNENLNLTLSEIYRTKGRKSKSHVQASIPSRPSESSSEIDFGVVPRRSKDRSPTFTIANVFEPPLTKPKPPPKKPEVRINKPIVLNTNSKISYSSNTSLPFGWFLKQTYSGPKLYKQLAPHSNRWIIMRAIEYSVFPGVVNRVERKRILDDLGKCQDRNFLLLFRDNRCRYRSLYSYNPESEIVKLCGVGPKLLKRDMIEKYFKYDSGAKQFNEVDTKHLSLTIDGVTIHHELWRLGKPAANVTHEIQCDISFDMF